MSTLQRGLRCVDAFLCAEHKHQADLITKILGKIELKISLSTQFPFIILFLVSPWASNEETRGVEVLECQYFPPAVSEMLQAVPFS